MSCWGCFAQAAKNASQNRENSKERRELFKKRVKNCNKSLLYRIEFSEEDKKKLMQLIYK